MANAKKQPRHRKTKRSSLQTTAPNISLEAGREHHDTADQALVTATPDVLLFAGAH